MLVWQALNINHKHLYCCCENTMLYKILQHRNPRSFLQAFLCSVSKSVMTVSSNSFLCNSFVWHFSCTVEPAEGFTTKAPQLLGRYRGSKIELNQSSPCMSCAKISIPDVEKLPSTCGRAEIYSIFMYFRKLQVIDYHA